MGEQIKAQAHLTITDLTDIDSIQNWYLATSASSGVTKATSGWTSTIQQMTTDKQYLWNYEQILGTGGVEISSTQPVIIGRYGKDGTNGTNGTNGVDGNSITSIDEYYQITNSTNNPGASGWSKNTLVVPTSTNKYLWNYQVINYSKTDPEGSYTDARIIGVYGDKGERGTSILKVTTQPTTTSGTAGGFSYSYRMSLSTVINESGKTEVLKGDIIEYNSNHYQVGYVNSSYVYLGPVTSIKGADSTQYYVFIRYSANSNGSGYVATPTSSTKYIGVYMGTSSSPPAYNNSGWTWSKYVGESATQYYAFVKYATDANGSNMQDTPASGYDYVGTYTGTKANPVASDFNWSKYTGEPGTPATQYYAFIKYATSSSGANMTDTPTSNTTYVGTYSGTKSNPTASDYKWSEYVGTDGVSVTSVRELYWLKTNSTNPSQITWNSSTSQPSQTIYSTDRANSWTSTVPTYVTNGTYYTCVETTLSNETKVWSAPVQNIALTNANSNAANALEQSTQAIGQVTSLDNRLQTFFWPGDSSYSGAFAVAKTSDDGLDVSNANTYGFNTRVATGLVSVGYNKIPLSEWGIVEGLKMYYPILDNGMIVDNKLGMQLLANSLTFYKANNSSDKALEIATDGINFYGSNQNDADATLTSNGLKLVKGGIEAGTPNTNNFVYISSTDFVGQIESFYRLTLDTEIEDDKTYYEYDEENNTYSAISSPTIEDIGSYYEYYTPSQGAIAIDNFVKRNWRQIIGTNFAVDSDGNLYASNADISGTINAESGSIGGFEINNTQLYSSGHDSPDSINNGIYIGSDKLAFGPTSTTYFENTGSGKIGPWHFDDGNIYINIDKYRTIKIGTNGLVLTDYDTVTNSNFETNGIEFNFGLQNNEYISVQILDKILIKDNKLTINADTITLNNKDLTTQLSLIDQNITDNKQRINNAFTYINNYEFYIATTPNDTSGYIQLKRKSNNNASSIKITDSIIELSINQNNITTYRGNLMHTTFGEFENLRMRVGTTGSLTWIARSNGHLSLKVVN